MKRFQKTTCKGCGKEVWVFHDFKNGNYGLKVTDYMEDGVHVYEEIFNDFNMVTNWAWNMANNGDVAKVVIEWLYDKAGIVEGMYDF